jgi:hypothetical protein
MKKIGIITLNGYSNYGNRLQNYAVQELLKSLGFYVETILVSQTLKASNRKIGKICRIYKLINLSPKEIIIKMIRKFTYIFNNNNYVRCQNKRIEYFKLFSKKYILETDFELSINKIPENISDRYDYFITGSDQVWNPNLKKDLSIYFLSFAPRNKRIAYAPSFGVSYIYKDLINFYKERLLDMSSLSVREKDGAKIIRELIGKYVPVLVDPTLMIPKEQWLRIAKAASNKPKSNYMLTYFLGEITINNKNYIKNIAKKNNLKIINLLDLKDRETYQIDPSGFIDYINSASLFCTDSFHGVVFSIILETPFIVFDRESNLGSMYSRINTLLTTFKLKSRNINNIKCIDQIFRVDFSHIAPILEIEQRKTIDYLKKALGIKKYN